MQHRERFIQLAQSWIAQAAHANTIKGVTFRSGIASEELPHALQLIIIANVAWRADNVPERAFSGIDNDRATGAELEIGTVALRQLSIAAILLELFRRIEVSTPSLCDLDDEIGNNRAARVAAEGRTHGMNFDGRLVAGVSVNGFARIGWVNDKAERVGVPASFAAYEPAPDHASVALHMPPDLQPVAV